MDNLSEELLDLIVSYVPAFHVNGRPYDHADILNLSKVSRQLNRISEPHLYRAINLTGDFQSSDTDEHIVTLLHTRPLLRNHVKALNLAHFTILLPSLPAWLSVLPNLRILELCLDYGQLSDLAPFLKLPTITTLRLSGVQFQCTEGDLDGYIGFVNSTISTLDISLADPIDPWETCDDIEAFVRIFANVQDLTLHSSEGLDPRCSLNAPVFRCLVHAFRRAFESTLRSFTYRYNDEQHGLDHYGYAEFSNHFDTRSLLKQSQLEHLTVETECLLRPGSDSPKSLLIGPACLPATLRTLYLRHHVPNDRLASGRENLMYSEEAQYLAQVLGIFGKASRYQNMIQATLVVFLPTRFAEVASRVVKKHTRHRLINMEIFFAPLEHYDSDDFSRSWPLYTAYTDPRHPAYDAGLLRFGQHHR